MTQNHVANQVADPVASMPRPTTATASRVVCNEPFATGASLHGLHVFGYTQNETQQI